MKIILLPLAWIYGVIIAIRNKLFDSNILKRRKFNIPVITVGNITMCGTGKTPHTEYLLSLLQGSCNLAVLSRGYMRKTKGYLLATEKTTTADIGDEPFQMYQKFPDINVAVCENRCEGIERLIEEEHTECVILDDAYQHRYVEPGLNILLVDYHRPISRDHLIPAGLLREPASAKKRADIIIVTKCPQTMSPIDVRVATNELRLLAFQKLFFSAMEYQPLYPLFIKENPEIPLTNLQGMNILLVTAIGSPQHIIYDLAKYDGKITPLHFRDHHQFEAGDIYKINEEFSFMSHPKIIITTEKDATRLLAVNGLSLDATKSTYVLPIKVKILLDQEEKFNGIIRDFVHKDSTDLNPQTQATTPTTPVCEERESSPEQSTQATTPNTETQNLEPITITF